MAAQQATYEITQDGDIITVTCAVGAGEARRTHSVKLHKDSKPDHASELRFSDMSDEQIVAAEEPSFVEFLKSAGQ